MLHYFTIQTMQQGSKARITWHQLKNHSEWTDELMTDTVFITIFNKYLYNQGSEILLLCSYVKV